MTLGYHNKDGSWRPFEIERRNFLFLGKGKGKTLTLRRLALEDIHAGESVVFIGDISPILRRIPYGRRKDVIVVNPELSPIGLNYLSNVPEEQHPAVASALAEGIKAVYFGSKFQASNVDQYLTMSIQTLLAVPGATIFNIISILTDELYRARALQFTNDPAIRKFWKYFEARAEKEKDRAMLIDSTINKLWTFAAKPLVRNSLGQKGNALQFEGKIVLVEVPPAKMGRESASLYVTLLLAYLCALGGHGLKAHAYIDDAYQYGMPVIRDLLQTKTISTQFVVQYLYQLDEPEMILGAVDDILAFRTSVADAKEIEDEFFLDTGDHLYSTKDKQAYLADGYGHVRLKIKTPSEFRINKGCDREILNRCFGQMTLRHESAIKKRISEVFNDLPPQTVNFGF